MKTFCDIYYLDVMVLVAKYGVNYPLHLVFQRKSKPSGLNEVIVYEMEEGKKEVLVLLRPPSGEEEVRLVLCKKEERGGLHGWLGQREVWQEDAFLPPSSSHISFIQQSLVASLNEPRCWDLTVTVSDGVRPLPRLVAALAFPLLQDCQDLHEAEALILPDYSIQVRIGCKNGLFLFF